MKFLNALPPSSHRLKKIDIFIQLNVRDGGRRGMHIEYSWESQKDPTNILYAFSVGSPGRRRVDNIKMVLREIKLGGMDRIDLARDWDLWMDF
jgi:hypothetical protein